MSRPCRILATVLLTGGLVSGAFAASDAPIPARPEQLSFPPLTFELPPAEGYRHELSNGIPVYIAEDHTLPLVDVAITLRLSSHVEPDDKTGLAAATGTLLRRGGTARLSAEEFDEQVELLAADINSFGGSTRSAASVDCITPALDRCLDLFFEMLKTPGFDADRLEIEKGNFLETMKQRNDDAQDILTREWGFLLYGEDFFAEKPVTADDLGAIGRDDLIAFHKAYWRPEHMVVAVSGDVDPEKILARLEKELGDWPGDVEVPAPWPPPKPDHQPEPGLYHVEKDIPQGKVFIGHLGLEWEDWNNPDAAPLRVMTEILGSGGFTSRITKRVRSDEGLAYSAGSVFTIDPFWPGQFRVFFQSKNPTVALAAKIALEEIRRIQDEPVSAEELQLAKQGLIESFPRRFESPSRIVGTYAEDEYLGRPHEYWQLWRERVRAVTAEDVQRVAQRHLRPDQLIFLVVGKWDEIAPGDADRRASMKEFFGGEVEHLPLRDPLTMQPLPASRPPATAPSSDAEPSAEGGR